MRMVCPKCKNEKFYVDAESGYDYGEWSNVTLVCTKCKTEESVYTLKFGAGVAIDLKPKEEEE